MNVISPLANFILFTAVAPYNNVFLRKQLRNNEAGVDRSLALYEPRYGLQRIAL